MFVAWSGLLSWVQITDVGRSLYFGSFCPAMTSLSRCLEEAAFSISYEIAKNINKITTKHTQNPTKEERQKLKTLQNVKRKLKNNNIIHVKADKGHGLVLINKNEYINKTLEFIKENNFMEIKKNPTNKYQREIKQESCQKFSYKTWRMNISTTSQENIK